MYSQLLDLWEQSEQMNDSAFHGKLDASQSPSPDTCTGGREGGWKEREGEEGGREGRREGGRGGRKGMREGEKEGGRRFRKTLG